MSTGRDIRPKQLWIPALVFVGFATLFVLLRSKDFFTVDGSFHCLEVYHRQHIFFDINNHLLYPVDVFAWTHLVGEIGFASGTPLEYFSTVEVMNCLAGAGALAILCLLLYLATSSWFQALGGTIGYGLCKAFIAQATNANQPMLGVFWSFLALLFALLSVKRRSLWPICVSGVLFALALATYQSTLFLAFVTVILISSDGLCGSENVRFTPHQFIRLGFFVCSGFAAAIAIFGWAYRRMGMTGLAAMVRHFFWHEEGRVYLKMNIGKLLNVPIGMLRNIFPLMQSYNGIRGLLARGDFASSAFIAVVGIFCGFLLFSAIRVSKKWAHIQPHARIGLVSATVGFAFTMVPVVIYDPQYDKLWIQPLACLTVFLVLALPVIAQNSLASFLLSRTALVLILVAVASNLVWVVRAHSREPYEMDQAQRLSTMIDKQDLLVGDWDHISVLYGSLWANDGQFFSFPTEAQRDGIAAESHLRALISQASQRNGHVYFLGILDEPKTTWDSFLGSRCGVPYSALDVYREHSSIHTTFKTRFGEIPLREFDVRSFN